MAAAKQSSRTSFVDNPYDLFPRLRELYGHRYRTNMETRGQHMLSRESVWAPFAAAQRGGMEDSEETVRAEQKGTSVSSKSFL